MSSYARRNLCKIGPRSEAFLKPKNSFLELIQGRHNIQHNNTQHNNIQHNDFRHNNKWNASLSIMELYSVLWFWVSHMGPLCWVSLRWVSFSWVSWRRFQVELVFWLRAFVPNAFYPSCTFPEWLIRQEPNWVELLLCLTKHVWYFNKWALISPLCCVSLYPML